MKKASFLLTAVALLSLVSCAGYRPGVSKPKQLAAVTKLAVPTFKNETLQPRLEVLVTNAVIKQLQIAGAYKIVPVGEADAVLHGVIEDITSRQYRAQRNNTIKTSQLLVGLILKYEVKGVNGEVLLHGEPRAVSTLILDPNFQVTRQQALADAASRLSETLSIEITEGW
ncbi:MAG: hypothetical protein K8R87_06560 [Verrucomicrobia bacterium]|nr:hypothetical protein [Verrucomicrobiota bacterium]